MYIYLFIYYYLMLWMVQKNIIFQVQFRNGVGIVGRGGGCQRLYGNGVGGRNDKSHFTDSIDTGDLRVIRFLGGIRFDEITIYFFFSLYVCISAGISSPSRQ